MLQNNDQARKITLIQITLTIIQITLIQIHSIWIRVILRAW